MRMGFGFGYGFDMFSVMFTMVFFIIMGFLIVTIVRSIAEWNKNNNSPRLTVEASVVAKRTHVSHQRHANAGDMSGAHGYHTSTSTRYYVTFQVESGDRMELSVNGNEFGLLIEGDRGKLSFQGTRYLGFERI